MKFFRSKAADRPPAPTSTPLGRRELVVGSGVAGAAAIAAAALHRGGVAAAGPAAAEPADAAAGYRETAHVLRYYETTRA